MRGLLFLGIICALDSAAQGVVMGKVTVTAEQAPIVQGKETVLTAKKGAIFDVSEVKGEWYGVLPSRGWIYKANVRYEPVAPASVLNAEAPTAATPAGGAVPVWAKVSQLQIDSARKVGMPVAKEIDLGGNLKMKLVLIPAGKFMMGEENNQHEVTLSKPFYVGMTQVTQAQYKAVMGTNPSNFKGETNPVEMVSWNDAADFCKKLSEKTGQAVRLPTEAEWEYACRAGTTTAYSFGDADSALGDYAWYGANSGSKTHPVGQKKPNSWGLYDMNGNVWQWCADWYGDYPKGGVTDPQGAASGTSRVLRGGCWRFHFPTCCRAASRLDLTQDFRDGSTGLRVVVSVSALGL